MATLAAQHRTEKSGKPDCNGIQQDGQIRKTDRQGHVSTAIRDRDNDDLTNISALLCVQTGTHCHLKTKFKVKKSISCGGIPGKHGRSHAYATFRTDHQERVRMDGLKQNEDAGNRARAQAAKLKESSAHTDQTAKLKERSARTDQTAKLNIFKYLNGVRQRAASSTRHGLQPAHASKYNCKARKNPPSSVMAFHLCCVNRTSTQNGGHRI